MNDARRFRLTTLETVLLSSGILAGCVILGLLANTLWQSKQGQPTAPPPPPVVSSPSLTPIAKATTLPSPLPRATATSTRASATPESAPNTPAPQKSPSPTPTLAATVAPSTATSTATLPLPPPTSAPPATPTTIPAAIIREETLTLATYAYTPALVVAPNFPYPILDTDKMGPLRPQSWRTVILENDALQLIFLPELGGRLYQITDKTSGQPILYNNPIIKPTHWGPLEMNWWLAAGGMEWDFPVEEHGYAWAMPWDTVTKTAGDGSAEITLTYRDRATQLIAEVSVVLPPTGRTFSITLTLSNPTDAPATGQLWTCAAFAAGPGMQMDFPATDVLVHSVGPSEELELTVGEVIPWQPDMGAWGRWRDWFSIFAAPVTAGTIDIWGAGDGPGARRNFDPATAPGLKLFTWGTETDTTEFEGSPYFEIWGGLTPDFETFITLPPGQKRQWTETWTIIANDE